MLEALRVPALVTCAFALAGLTVVAGCSGETPASSAAEDSDASPEAAPAKPPASDAAPPETSKTDAGGDAGCVHSWAITGIEDAEDPDKLVADVSGGGLNLRIEPGSTNNGVLMGVMLEAPLVSGDFVIEVAYRDFALLDDHDVASVRLEVSLVEEPFVPPSYDYAFISAAVSKTSASVSASVFDNGQNTSDAFADKATPAQMAAGTVRLARSGGQLTLQLEAGGKTWSLAGPFGLPSLALRVQLGNIGPSAGKLTIDRVTIGSAGAPTSIFADDFSCDSRLP